MESDEKNRAATLSKNSPIQCVLIETMAGKGFPIRAIKRSPVAALLLLCLLWSLGSLRIDLLPASASVSLPRLQREALPFAWLAITSSLFAAFKGSKWPQGRHILSAIFFGLGLFVVPALLVFFSNEWISELTRVALFSLVPVFTVVFEPHISGTTGEQRRGALIAALVAVGGTFCIFPAQVPNSIAGAAAFSAIVLAAACSGAANCLAVRAASPFDQMPIATMAAICGATAFAAFAGLGLLLEGEVWQSYGLGPELAWSAAVGLPGLLLLFWLLPRMSAVRMTTRFVIAPLMATLFGVVLFRPEVSLRALLGLVLVAAGAAWLLIAPDEEPDGPSLPLNLNRE
jgi:drug/metabolite transporter (DMT)-like permease